MSLYALEASGKTLRRLIRDEIEKKRRLTGLGPGVSKKLLGQANGFVKTLSEQPQCSDEFRQRVEAERNEKSLPQGNRFLNAITDPADDEHDSILVLLRSKDPNWPVGILKVISVAVGSLLKFVQRHDSDKQRGRTGDGTSSTPAPIPAQPLTKAAADGGGKAGSRVNVPNDFEKRLASLERQTKKPPKTPTKTERIRDQRIKFCCPKRRKKSPETWNEIYDGYHKKYSSDKTASPDSLRLSHDRNCLKCREQKS